MTVTCITKLNEVHLQVITDRKIAAHISRHFQFEVPNARYMRKPNWDGRIRLFSVATGKLYIGLLYYLIKFLRENGYQYHIDINTFRLSDKSLTPEKVYEFTKSLDLPLKIRDYQLKAVHDCIKAGRTLLLSPTGSGKSLVIYLLVRWYFENNDILIIVPTISLVEQMYKDFHQYGFDFGYCIHKITAGVEKNTVKPIVISTWQSIYKEPESFFKRFGLIIGDEAHQWKAASLKGVMERCYHTPYRIGLTGTLDGLQTHRFILEGLFGRVNKVVRTDDLIEKGVLSTLDTKILLLDHDRRYFHTYHDELGYICSHNKRNNLIVNLIFKLKGNTLILFNYVDKHGRVLKNLIEDRNNKHKLHFIHGKVKADQRELARVDCEKNNNVIVLASYGTFSTGINIKNLHNLIFALSLIHI